MPIYKSPSSIIRPVDLTTTDPSEPVGTPAIVIGTSRRGIPFAPVTVGNFDDFKRQYGDIDNERFGPVALKLWLRNRSAGTYVKLLGIGDGKKRQKTGADAGTVSKAGFIAGSRQVQSSSGVLTHNENAYTGGSLGRTYFLGCFMSESAGSTVFSDAGIQIKGENKAKPIIRGMLIAASGVNLSLNTEAAANNTPSGVATGEFSSAGDAGLSYGDVLMGAGDKQKFVVILNGFKPNSEFGNTITASFDPSSGDLSAKPIREAFNTDPTKLEKSGHYLHFFHDIDPKFAVPTASNVTSHADTNTPTSVFTDGINAKLYQTAFLLTSSLNRNSGSQTTTSYIGVPNFENFENRYQDAFSPSVFSQRLQGKTYDLFRVYAKDSGTAGSLNYKITIDSFQCPEDFSISNYPKFNLHVRDLKQPDSDFYQNVTPALETFEGINLDPTDDNYISKVIGDVFHYYDFDKDDPESQKTSIEGLYRGRSRLIRVKVADEVEQQEVPEEALPIGFRGIHHLVTSGSTLAGSILTGTSVPAVGSEGTLSTSPGISTETIKSVVQPPLSFREGIFSLSADDKKTVSNRLTWGLQVETKTSPTNPNQSVIFDDSIQSHLLYMPDFHKSYQKVWVGDNHGADDIGGCVLDADRFNNNVFSLERIEVLTSSTDVPDKNQWAHALYRRSGKTQTGTLQNSNGVFEPSRFLRGSDFKDKETQKYLKFTFPLIGGFDGVNIFDYEKSNFTNTAVIREINDPAQGGRKGPTVAAYRKALEVLEDKIETPGSVLTIPGIRHSAVVDEAIELANKRADIFYIFDLQEKDDLNVDLTGSFNTTSESLTNTRNHFLNNPRETTYAAAYFPDVMIDIDLPGVEAEELPGHRVPPTVAVLGTMSRRPDQTKLTGPTDGSVKAISTTVTFTDSDVDEFFQAGINLISGPTLQEGPAAAPDGPFLRSQNTLMKSLNPSTRIAVRRTLLFVRRRVREIMDQFFFDNMTDTLFRKMREALDEELSRLQQQRVFRHYTIKMPASLFRVKETDFNNNTIRYKILIRPNGVSEDLIVASDDEDKNTNSY